jgi:hypothetical protein
MTPACRVRFAPISAGGRSYVFSLQLQLPFLCFFVPRSSVASTTCCFSFSNLDSNSDSVRRFDAVGVRLASGKMISSALRTNGSPTDAPEELRSKSGSHRENEIRPRALTGWCRRVIVHAADAGYEAISTQIENPRATVAVTSPQLLWPQSCRLRSPQCLVVYSRLSVASIARTRARAIPGASTRIDPCGFVQTG